jgi:hypothetical protein
MMPKGGLEDLGVFIGTWHMANHARMSYDPFPYQSKLDVREDIASSTRIASIMDLYIQKKKKKKKKYKP